MDENNEKPSKSQLKRDANAKQKFGEQLIYISRKDIETIGLSDQLLDAILLAQTMKQDGSLKRQKQLIGKLMRLLTEEEFCQIQQKVNLLTAGTEEQKIVEHWVEDKVVRLLNNDRSVFEEISKEVGEVDYQSIRQLVRNANNEMKKEGKSKSRTLLFRELRTLFSKK